jgi:hypothetical protein
MTTYEIKGTNGRIYRVTAERHGYRTRFWENGAGYIGSYFPTSKRFAFNNGERMVEGTSKGPKSAAKAIVENLFY